MPWARLDDTFWRHEKVNAAGPLGIALFAASLSYCNDRLTDGFIADSSLWQLLNCQGLQDEDGPITVERVAQRLIDAGLWTREPNGYRVHDYLHYNKSRTEVLAEREEARVRMSGHRRSPELRANIAPCSETPVPGNPVPGNPDPGIPEPEPSVGAGAPTKAKKPTPKVSFGPETVAFKLATRLRGRILANKPDAKVPGATPEDLAGWSAEMDRLVRLDKRDPAEVERVIDWCQADRFWWSNILSPPSLREKYDSLCGKMRSRPANGAGRVEVNRGSPEKPGELAQFVHRQPATNPPAGA